MIKEYGMMHKLASQIILGKKRHLLIHVFLIISSLLRLSDAEAVEGFGTLEQSIKVIVTIEKLPCKIRGKGSSEVISVDFGDDVMTTKIDGTYKARPIEYSISCTGNVGGNAMQIQIAGDSASFDSEVLQTEQADFGIAIMNNGQKLPINSWLNFNYPQTPRLTAVPVKRVGATLSGGVFSAAATMKIEYQ